MLYIDKVAGEKKGKITIDSLLNECWSEEQGKYLNADYSTLCKPDFRNPFIKTLAEEQNSLCCYCMKLLEEHKEMTLEHFIPQNCTPTDFDLYVHPNFAENVIHKSKFNQTRKDIPPQKYPHDISYHNLLLSCNDNTHCNLRRGSRYIQPLVFDADIKKCVSYDKAGIAYSDKYFDEITQLNLSVETLKLYRKIWFKIVDSNPDLDLDHLDVTRLQELILTPDILQSPQAIEKFVEPNSKTSELLKYRWFYTYYKENGSV